MANLVLVADIGATHARFALADEAGLAAPAVDLPTAQYRNLADAARASLSLLWKSLPFESRVTEASVAVAGPVTGDAFELTNAGWSFSVEATRRELGLERLLLLNDFEALAWSVPGLAGADLEMLREGVAVAGAPIALIGPGTGLGVAALVPVERGWKALAGEGGHRDLAATTEREWRVVERLAARFGHVSAERALSGEGLVDLRNAVRGLAGLPTEALEPAEVSAKARAGGDPAAVEAAQLFSRWLGAVAGDLALTLGARGGLFLGGGVIEGLGSAFDRALFLSGFGEKGRFRDYLGGIPVRYIVAGDAALRGARAALSAAAGR